MYWNEKPYHSLNYHLQTTYGEKLYKLALNGGMTCPNRDGTLGQRGCIFCSQGGSGEFAGNPAVSITEQIEAGQKLLAPKTGKVRYIGYFQAYTNTYGDPETLRTMFMEAITHPDIRILSIATRPDCLSADILDLLGELQAIKPVWVELGLQTIHEDTARFIRRGYSLSCFTEAVTRLHERNIPVIPHIILGLPGESPADIYDTIAYMNQLSVAGIKLQLLHILKDTDLADYYAEHPFPIYSLDEYTDLITECLVRLDPSIVIHRLTGDGPADLLIAPQWSRQKRMVLNTIHKKMKDRNLWQGKGVQTCQNP